MSSHQDRQRSCGPGAGRRETERYRPRHRQFGNVDGRRRKLAETTLVMARFNPDYRTRFPEYADSPPRQGAVPGARISEPGNYRRSIKLYYSDITRRPSVRGLRLNAARINENSNNTSWLSSSAVSRTSATCSDVQHQRRQPWREYGIPQTVQYVPLEPWPFFTGISL